MIKIPNLKSRYIPVHNMAHIKKYNCTWWRSNDLIHYPNVLINLDTTTKEEIIENIDKDVFLLCDSGGFQVIRGTCNFNWKSSLQRQIELGASKVFSFDIPPVKRKNDIGNDFITMPEDEVMKTIEINIETALEQSKWLKENNPEALKRFCYVAQGTSMSTFRYNFQALNKKIGMEKYSEYFPGGLACSGKKEDILFYAFTARYLKEKFIDKGIYVHYLGIGSFYKMAIMVRNEITTFDSSNVLRGASHWEVYNPFRHSKIIKINKENFFFKKQFCLCPSCSKIDFNQLLKDEKYNEIGIAFIQHNLYHHLILNVFLDGLTKSQYTQKLKECFNVPEKIQLALEFCDYADENGFEIAYGKYKHYIKKDETKQKSLY